MVYSLEFKDVEFGNASFGPGALNWVGYLEFVFLGFRVWGLRGLLGYVSDFLLTRSLLSPTAPQGLAGKYSCSHVHTWRVRGD